MKAFSLFIFIFIQCEFCGQAQTSEGLTQQLSAKPFNLEITDWNHASMIYKGTFIYLMTDTCVKVFNIPAFERKRHLLFTQEVSKFALSIIGPSSLNLDALDSSYFNLCVMPTSGEEYSVTFKNATLYKRILLHHYYLGQIEHIVDLFNDNLPDDFKLKYLARGTRQDCTLGK